MFRWRWVSEALVLAATVLILAALTACNADLDKRVAALEKRVDACEANTKQLFTNDEALRTTFVAAISDTQAALQVSGVITRQEVDGEKRSVPVMRWWCNDFFCYRTADQCETSGGMLDAAHAMKGSCHPQPRAFCELIAKPGQAPFLFCHAELASCLEDQKRNTRDLPVCVGVE